MKEIMNAQVGHCVLRAHVDALLDIILQLKVQNVPEMVVSTLSAHSAVDLHLKEISEFLHVGEMNKNLIPFPA